MGQVSIYVVSTGILERRVMTAHHARARAQSIAWAIHVLVLVVVHQNQRRLSWHSLSCLDVDCGGRLLVFHPNWEVA